MTARALLNTFRTPTGSDSADGGSAFGTAYPPGPPGSTTSFSASFNQAIVQDIAVTLPVGSPGHLLVLTFAGGTSTDLTPPAGWFVLHQTIDNEFMAVAYKVRGVAEPNPTFTRTATSAMVWFAFNFSAANRNLPATLDASTHTSDSSPSASYVGTGVTTTAPNSMLIFMTCASLNDTTGVTLNTGPNSSTGLIFSSGLLSTSPFTYGRWQQVAFAFDGAVPYIFRAYVAFWDGQGATGQVAYPSPAGNTASTSFLLAFKE